MDFIVVDLMEPDLLTDYASAPIAHTLRELNLPVRLRWMMRNPRNGFFTAVCMKAS